MENEIAVGYRFFLCYGVGVQDFEPLRLPLDGHYYFMGNCRGRSCTYP